MFEKVIMNTCKITWIKNCLLSRHQSGFRQNSSSMLVVRSIYNDRIIQNTNQNMYTCCLFLDLSKAFDTVDHDILLQKLYNIFSVRDTTHCLFKCYPNTRYQYVKILNSTSNPIQVTCGVPLGSCLNPILFLPYVNDQFPATNFSSLLFADDTLSMISDKNSKR